LVAKPKVVAQEKPNSDYVSGPLVIKNDAIQQPIIPSDASGPSSNQTSGTSVNENATRISAKAPVQSGRHSTRAETPKATCEDYREAVQKYFGVQTDTALFIASKESGCQNIRSHKMNPNGTWDYCIFQINNEPNVLNDIDTCVRRAWEKYKGRGNWSAWYAVCTPGKNPQPKYAGIKCQ